jgi:hypothetical protein
MSNSPLGRKAPITADDGVEALRIAVAARRAYQTGHPVTVSSIADSAGM